MAAVDNFALGRHDVDTALLKVDKGGAVAADLGLGGGTGVVVDLDGIRTALGASGAHAAIASLYLTQEDLAAANYHITGSYNDGVFDVALLRGKNDDGTPNRLTPTDVTRSRLLQAYATEVTTALASRAPLLPARQIDEMLKGGGVMDPLVRGHTHYGAAFARSSNREVALGFALACDEKIDQLKTIKKKAPLTLEEHQNRAASIYGKLKALGVRMDHSATSAYYQAFRAALRTFVKGRMISPALLPPSTTGIAKLNQVIPLRDWATDKAPAKKEVSLKIGTATPAPAPVPAGAPGL